MKCEHNGCRGHLAKFQSCLTEALWTLLLDSATNDGETGSTEAYGHYALVLLEEAEEINIGTDDTPDMVTIPTGFYVVETLDNGAVYRNDFRSEIEARAFFTACETAYAGWLDVNEPE